MFDKLLSWWSSQAVESPNSKQFEEEVHSKVDERMKENDKLDKVQSIE